MKDNQLRFTLRISPIMMKKLGHIAQFEGRTKNKEIEQLIKRRIEGFEEEHGKIVVFHSNVG